MCLLFGWGMKNLKPDLRSFHLGLSLAYSCNSHTQNRSMSGTQVKSSKDQVITEAFVFLLSSLLLLPFYSGTNFIYIPLLTSTVDAPSAVLLGVTMCIQTIVQRSMLRTVGHIISIYLLTLCKFGNVSLTLGLSGFIHAIIATALPGDFTLVGTLQGILIGYGRGNILRSSPFYNLQLLSFLPIVLIPLQSNLYLNVLFCICSITNIFRSNTKQHDFLLMLLVFFVCLVLFLKYGD